MNICIYGASSNDIAEAYKADVYRLGEMIGQTGNTLVFGAGDTGIMGAAARGVHAGGGRVIGIAPRFFDTPGVLYPSCDEMLFTDTMNERKEKLVAMSDVFVTAPGGIGTMDEFFETVTLASLDVHTKPTYLLNTNGFYDGLLAVLQDWTAKGFIAAASLATLHVLPNAEAFQSVLAGA